MKIGKKGGIAQMNQFLLVIFIESVSVTGNPNSQKIAKIELCVCYSWYELG